MANYGLFTAQTLIGRVKQMRPDISPQFALALLNDRVRSITDYRPTWADLIKRGIISIPNSYQTGTVSMATNSTVVSGAGTTLWPVNDVVNTNLAAPVQAGGFTQVAVNSIQGISYDSFLLIDAGTPSQEIVAVVGMTTTPGNFSGTFTAQFTFAHPTNATVQASSLAGLQFSAGSNYPIFTVIGIQDASTAILDNPWGGPPVTAASYTILKMYTSIASNIRELTACVDQQQGLPLNVHISQAEINSRDPQRTDRQDPLCLADMGPDARGNAQWEIWPASVSARQLYVLYFMAWPEMQRPTDVPPPFINPSVLIDGAIADALRQRKGPRDPYYNPRGADDFEKKFNMGLRNAINADDSRIQQSVTSFYSGLLAPGANYWQAHDPDALEWAM